MASKEASQALITKLLKAEKDAEGIIQQAKENRRKKMQQAKDAAEAELAKFRSEQEAAFEADKAKKEAENRGADRSKADEMEIAMVQQDFQMHKDETIDYIVKKVLDVTIGLSSTQIQALKTGTV